MVRRRRTGGGDAYRSPRQQASSCYQPYGRVGFARGSSTRGSKSRFENTVQSPAGLKGEIFVAWEPKSDSATFRLGGISTPVTMGTPGHAKGSVEPHAYTSKLERRHRDIMKSGSCDVPSITVRYARNSVPLLTTSEPTGSGFVTWLPKILFIESC
jgi:hypothetical protein